MDLYKQIVHPDDRLDFSNPARVVTDGTLTDRRFRILRPNGEMRWIRSSGRLIHSPEGQALQMIGVAFDATDTRRGAVALRKYDGLLDSLRELLGVVIWETEADGTVADTLDWRRNVGNIPGQPQGWGRLESVHPADRSDVRAAWQEALENKRRYAARYRVIMEGTDIEIVSRGASIRSESGAVEGWVGFSIAADKLMVTDLGQSEGLAPDLVRAARAHLDWTVSDMATKTGLSLSTIRRAESAGERPTTGETMALIRRTFEMHGLQFVTTARGAGIIKVK